MVASISLNHCRTFSLLDLSFDRMYWLYDISTFPCSLRSYVKKSRSSDARTLAYLTTILSLSKLQITMPVPHSFQLSCDALIEILISFALSKTNIVWLNFHNFSNIFRLLYRVNQSPLLSQLVYVLAQF